MPVFELIVERKIRETYRFAAEDADDAMGKWIDGLQGPVVHREEVQCDVIGIEEATDGR